MIPRTSHDSIQTQQNPVPKKSVKTLNIKYKKNSLSSLQTLSSPLYESSHRLSLDLPRNSLLSEEEATSVSLASMSMEPLGLSAKRKRSRRHGLSFHELNSSKDEKRGRLPSHLMDDNAVSTVWLLSKFFLRKVSAFFLLSQQLSIRVVNQNIFSLPWTKVVVIPYWILGPSTCSGLCLLCRSSSWPSLP